MANKVIWKDCIGSSYTIKKEGIDLNEGTFAIATDGTQISPMFILNGIFTGKTKIIKED